LPKGKHKQKAIAVTKHSAKRAGNDLTTIHGFNPDNNSRFNERKYYATIANSIRIS